MIRYRFLILLTAIGITGLILTFVRQLGAADWLLGIGSVIAGLSWLRQLFDEIRGGVLGTDIFGIVAIVTALMLHQFWAGMVLAIIVTAVRLLTDYAGRRVRAVVNAVLAAHPTTTRVQRGQKVADVPVHLIKPGDRLLLTAGDIVPVDAIVIDGSAALDEHILTGHSDTTKSVDDQIFSGARLQSGTLTAKATAAAAGSHYQHITTLVRSVIHSQAPFVRQAVVYSNMYSAMVLIIGAVAWALSDQATRFLAAIIMAATGSMLVSPTLALTGSLGRLLRHGIIVRTGTAFERLAAARSFAFGKSGVLYEGNPVLSSIHTVENISDDEALQLAGAAASQSSHPVSKAIVAAAQERSLGISRGRHAHEAAGQGITASVGNKKIILGQLSLLDKYAVSRPSGWKAPTLSANLTYLAVDGQLAAVLAFTDELRPEAPSMLRRLKDSGVRQLALLTGEPAASIRAAKNLPLTAMTTDATPADKLRAIDGMTERPVIFVGNGVTDAPVLTAADVGVAFGAYGSAAACESADIVIMTDELSFVSLARSAARRTFRTVRWIAFGGAALSLVLVIIGGAGFIAPIYGSLVHGALDTAAILLAVRAGQE